MTTFVATLLADFDWGRVGKSALIGAGIGAAIGLVMWLIRRGGGGGGGSRQ